MKCEFSNKCTFYKDHIAIMPVTASVYKRMYCDLDFVKCARNMVASELRHELVPHNLFPTQSLRATNIIGINNQATTGWVVNESWPTENVPDAGEEKPLHHEKVA